MMQNISIISKLLSAGVIACVAGGLSTAAMAGAGVPEDTAKAPQKRMDVSIRSSADTSRNILLPLNKAAIINLPMDARDVLVANPTIVDAIVRTSRQVYLLGLASGETNAFFFDEHGNQILNLEISVERDVTRLQDMLDAQFPGSKISVTNFGPHVVLSGQVDSASASANAVDIAARFAGGPANVVNTMTLHGQEQVMVKVKIAELNRSVIKQLGVDWAAIAAKGEFAAGAVLQNAFNVNGSNLSGLSPFLINPNDVEENLLSTLGYQSNNLGLEAALQALERQSLVRILAEPTLTAISGETATFLAGGEFPIPVGGGDGEVTIAFKRFGVALAFTPIVLGQDRISLKISTEVSDISNQNSVVLQEVAVPSLTVRRAETTVEMQSGGSMAIAGLINQSTRSAAEGLPGVKDVPVLGALFKSNDFINNESELVIVVTPYFVEPTHESQLAAPTDGFAPASDFDAYLMGRLHAVYGSEDTPKPDGQVTGPIGFIME